MGQDRKYQIGGYRPAQRPDHAQIHQTGRFDAKQLPPKVDLRKHMTDVESQVGNSCVANAFVGAYEYLAKRALGESSDVSRLFVYYNSHVRHDSQMEDGGTFMYCAIEALKEYGACCEDLWPNDKDMIFKEPDEGAYDQASNFTITEAEFLETNLDLWRHTLAEGYPIAFALNTFQSFDEASKNKGRVPLPKASDNVRETHGWHAMLCVGYSDKDRMFTVRNSWGPEWGDKGYCYIPYDYVMHKDHNAHDSWMIKAVNDLDFSAGVWEEDESLFADEDSLLLYDFYVTTADPEGFAEALDALCLEYTEDEESYYFDYDYEEVEEGEATSVSILNFDLTIEDPEEFLEALDALCSEYAEDEDYDYNLEASDEDEEEEEDDEDEDEEDEDEEEDDEDDEE